MRWTNVWIGAVFGATVAVAGGLAVDGAVNQASAQGGFTVSAAQLQINQKISQAAVRRSNRSLNYLAPVRTTTSDAADSGDQGVKPLSSVPGAGQGWTSSHLADNAVTSSKVTDGAVTESKLSEAIRNRLPMWAVVESTGALRRATTGVTSTRINAGNYRVNFGRDLRQCAYTGTQDEVTAGNIGFVGIEVDVANNQQLFVRTTDQSGTSADRPFNVQVTC